MHYIQPNRKTQYDTDRGSSPTPTSLRNESIYGLWGQYYNPENGWHRGVDVCPEGSVHAILSGVVVMKSSYYLSIYSQELDVTLTYMHLNQGYSIEKDDGTTEFKTINNEESITQGEQIGTEGNLETNSAHTHLEINYGLYTSGMDRPWVAGEGIPTIKVTKISPLPGGNFSLNPYPYIDIAWGLLAD